MELSGLILSILPPGLAILVQLLSPFDSEYFQRQAVSVAKQQADPGGAIPVGSELHQLAATMTTLLRESSKGAASLAGLAPTFVAFFLAAVAILFSMTEPFWWIVAIAIMGIVSALLVFRVISGKNLVDIATATSFGSWTPANLVSAIIYGSNLLLIALAIFVFFWVREPAHRPVQVDSNSSATRVSSIQPPPSSRSPS
jgi:hypothetical protein